SGKQKGAEEKEKMKKTAAHYYNYRKKRPLSNTDFTKTVQAFPKLQFLGQALYSVSKSPL
ncbi:MAG: hypothetical protein LBH35_08815, partial [Treponema sp.]|nr:hypothetical protein [Treponema sp.]